MGKDERASAAIAAGAARSGATQSDAGKVGRDGMRGGVGSGGAASSAAFSTACLKRVKSSGKCCAANGRAAGSSMLDCQTVWTDTPAARKASTSACSSGAAIVSHQMALAPTARISPGKTSAGAPCNSTRPLPSAARSLPSAARLACSHCSRCRPVRAKPQRDALCGAWQYTGNSRVAPAHAKVKAGLSSRRKSLRNQYSSVLMLHLASPWRAPRAQRRGSGRSSISPNPSRAPIFCAKKRAAHTPGTACWAAWLSGAFSCCARQPVVLEHNGVRDAGA